MSVCSSRSALQISSTLMTPLAAVRFATHRKQLGHVNPYRAFCCDWELKVVLQPLKPGIRFEELEDI